MELKSLQLTNFKNIAHARLDLSPKLNCFLGNNGMGKSNLLDAVYYLSFCKSFTGMADAALIRNTEDFMLISARYTRHGADEELAVGMQRGRRKSFKRGGKEYKRLSEHIGKFPLVMVAPSDMALVDGAGEERRRFMDMVISQTDSRYLDMLIRYNRALEQRNRLLREGCADINLYLSVEAMLCAAGDHICACRRQWIEKLETIFRRRYGEIGDPGEEVSLRYKSHLADPGVRMADLTDERRQRDAILKYTTAGPHRDDIDMQISGMPVRRCASQGQAKTYTIALRLAQYEFIKEAAGMSPILLLDDIFDKLDSSRVGRIVDVVSKSSVGQILITDTNREHLDEILAHTHGDYAMWQVTGGEFTKIHISDEEA